MNRSIPFLALAFWIAALGYSAGARSSDPQSLPELGSGGSNGVVQDALARDAVCTTYRVYKVCGMGPPSSGATTVFGILGMVELALLDDPPPPARERLRVKDSPMSWHVLAEAMQLAYADRETYLGDGDFVDVPVQGLLDKAYLAGRASMISPFKGAGAYAPGTPPGAPARTRSRKRASCASRAAKSRLPRSCPWARTAP